MHVFALYHLLIFNQLCLKCERQVVKHLLETFRSLRRSSTMEVITPCAASVLQTMTKAQVLCAVVWGIITVEKPSAPMQYMRKMPCRLEDVTQAKELKAAPPVETHTAISLLREGHVPPEILWAYRSFATSRWVEHTQCRLCCCMS